MARLDQTLLRIELLRMRAAIERTELRGAIFEFKGATQPVGRLVNAVTGVAQRLDARGSAGASIIGTILGMLRERSWLLPTLATLSTRSSVSRKLLLAAVAGLVAWLVVRLVAEPKAKTDESG